MSTTTALGVLDIQAEQYHSIHALSNSGMKDLMVSPLRYWYRHINPAPKPEEEESSALRIGSALHCAVLESPEAFDSRYACELDPASWPVCLDTMQELRGWITDKGEKPKGTRKDEVIEQALLLMKNLGESVPILQVEESRFYAANQGKTILRLDEWERLAGMAQALSEEDALRPILAHGKPEVAIVARDPETGILLKAKLDWVSPKATLDLKTFSLKRGASIDKAIFDAIWYEGYYRQAYFYHMVRKLALGEDCDFVEAFVESDQPHETRIKRMLPKRGGSLNMYWETARQEVRGLIRIYADCQKKYGDNPWREKQDICTLADEQIKQLAWAS
jgi:hypothetical protein